MAEEPKEDLRHTHVESGIGTQPALDVAGDALGNALRLSFRILTVIILFLIALYLASGFFIVQSDEMAVVVRYGTVESSRVLGEGVHYAFPYPIDEVVRIWIRPRTLQVNTFWSRLTDVEKDALAEGRKSREEVDAMVEGAEDAFMLTGDLNILQSRWEVTYGIRGLGGSEAARKDAMLDYYTKIGIAESFEYDDMKRYEEERKLMRVLLQAAVVQQIGHMKVDLIYPLRSENPLPERVRATMNEILDSLGCGITVRQVNVIDIRPPKEVKPAFDAVLSSSNEAKTMTTDAEQEAARLLIETAGKEVGEQLGTAITAWWVAKESDNAAEMHKQEARISQLFEKAGGNVESILVKAKAYKTRMIEQARSDADQILQLRKLPERSVKTFLDHARIEALQQVLDNCYEKYLYRPMGNNTNGTLELIINRRPELLRKQREEIEGPKTGR